MALLGLDDVQVGQSFSEEVLFDEATIERFLGLTRDTASIHTNEAFSRQKGFETLVVHGFLLSIQFSRILGMELPGENTVIGTIQLEFHAPVYVGDRVTYTASVRRILRPLGTVALDLDIRKADGTVCVEGKASCVFKT